MKTRILCVLNSVALASALVLGLVPAGHTAFAQDKSAGAQAPATEDILHMADGRVLRGQIISKTKTEVIFEYFDTKVNIKTRLKLAVENILKIEEDVAAGSSPAAPAASPTATPAAGASPKPADKLKAAEERKTYGAARVQTEDPNVPSIYIVPMKGQMGTDINKQVYEKVRDDILEKKPTVVVIELNCQDTEDVLYPRKGKDEQGLVELDTFRDMVNIFQDDLSQFRQVCWVHDSLGISSMVALSWQELYMKPPARLGGLVVAREETGFEKWQDADVRGKMTAAFMAWVKGFLEGGHYAFELAEAMVRPQFTLSATWKGREVTWSLDDTGEYLVDGSDKKTTEFRAKDAEDLCVSDGTAETIEDLALLLGYREFRMVDSAAEKICADYVEDWRRAFEKCETQLEDYKQFLGWASGEDAVKYLGQAKAALENVLSAMERYEAVEYRIGFKYGLDREWFTIQIEIIKERLRSLKSNKPAGGGGGSGGGSFGGGRKP
ncbi:MAG: hypothetical protein L0Y44_12005 [Phycisphaerales bacterium]|nr:hypothetical protein [Phycisphaerales bacterium]MCI0631363.1 hypothetical protein [Phycisphaerales bacterium]MCI0675508.1 hypothetical protein [Phycisphaerales bacterium]